MPVVRSVIKASCSTTPLWIEWGGVPGGTLERIGVANSTPTWLQTGKPSS
ncbi:hypothetical protein TRAPUB_2077 [Trametes pubescens]|uniref:Uncharacterized protein n=1 Tax=Trametes pubescens TaxID=154538 RepID=A0A1M2VHL3_TRAPU|nr:hypothetical protein TRAPUB_2077 [Trametes pubescens]